ncbi:hypothetical protein EDB81DRAFT_796324 [Dactylonectria macrodidyma]|uniref:Uncharacterized protein n=1 Tax=Dactylonectria macrodidyma TaxID=307937 RepID=A0A9P9ETT3_9HYPO|nr:hypothetical protein EDB81DRAFT_796324 [Dactylonectria macrodidyma]
MKVIKGEGIDIADFAAQFHTSISQANFSMRTISTTLSAAVAMVSVAFSFRIAAMLTMYKGHPIRTLGCIIHSTTYVVVGVSNIVGRCLYFAHPKVGQRCPSTGDHNFCPTNGVSVLGLVTLRCMETNKKLALATRCGATNGQWYGVRCAQLDCA